MTLWPESLELRRLLAATPSVASAMTFAIGLPIASLEAGAYTPVPAETTWQNANQTTQEIVSADLALENGQSNPGTSLATPAQSFSNSQASISLPVFESSYGAMPYGPSVYGPSASGPASTLNPLGSTSETAIAAASEVAHPTPGRSDRISTIVRARPIVPLPHYETPESSVITQPEIREKPAPPAVAPPVEAPAKPVEPAERPIQPPPVEPVPVPEIKKIPDESKDSTSFNAWDEAIERVETELTEATSAVPTSQAESSLAVGALLAAWSGWKFRSNVGRRSSRRTIDVELMETGREGADC